MSFPSQCIIHVFKLHAFPADFFRKKRLVQSLTCSLLCPDGINFINQSSVFSCVDQHQLSQDLEDKLRKKTKCLPRLLGCNNLRHNCWVVGIDLSNRSDVSGSLDKNFKQLKDLKQLNLENTKASGDISLLCNNTKLHYLNLRNTSVFGDLAALQKATQLKDSSNFEVSNTNIACPQEAALKAVLVKLGFQEQQLQDLHAMEGIRWMLSSRSSLTFYPLAAHGLASNFFGFQKSRQKIRFYCLAPYGLASNFYWGREDVQKF